MGTRELVSVAARVVPLSHNPFPSLERLPFPPNYFDFVRMCSLGLAIPEDEVRPFVVLPPNRLM